MTLFAWILLLLFVLILAMLLSIVLYHPKQEETVPEQKAENVPVKEEKTEIDHSFKNEKILQELFVRYPDMKMYMEAHTLDHGVLLKWKGSCRRKEMLLLSIANEECRNACMEAVQRIIDHSEVPDTGFYLMLPCSLKNEKEASEECRNYLRDKGVHISGVLMDGSDNEFILHQARSQALIGTSTGAYLEVKVHGNSRKTQAWIERLQPAEMFELHSTKYVHRIVSSLKKQIPWMIKMELTVYPKKGVRDLLTMMPSSWVWMRASMEKKNDSVILRGADSTLIQNAYAVLEEEASRNSFYLSEGMRMHETAVTQKDDRIYQRINTAAARCFNIKGVVPVPVGQTGYLGCYEGWKTCRYLPLTENKKESAESAILFYQYFLLQA
jgi:hypothetical protein